MRTALTFDDVLMLPGASSVLPHETSIVSRFSRNITLSLPIVSAAMDTVTESRLAIAMAQAGGLGVLHRNMDIDLQAAEVTKVKKYESGMVVNPVTITPQAPLREALDLMQQHRISGIPVVEKDGRLVGILTNRDIRFVEDTTPPVETLMTRQVVTAAEGISRAEARKMLHQHRIEKLLVVDGQGRCIGLITVKDMQKEEEYPNASKDAHGRLRVAAATGTGEQGIRRAQALFAAGADAVVVDTAHGHSQKVIDTVRAVLSIKPPHADVVAGNVATGAATSALIAAGVDGVKVGIGPGSICTTRIVAGIGVPQLTAVQDCVEAARAHDIPIIADGGIRTSGDIAKAIAAGASAIMAGGLFAGTEESPGETFLYQGRSYKAYRGMGSVGAMARGSADRYFQQQNSETMKFVPEGVEGRVAYKGRLADILHQLSGGLRASMGYIGAATIAELQQKAEFVQITGAGMRESHVHDISITREAPNYPTG